MNDWFQFRPSANPFWVDGDEPTLYSTFEQAAHDADAAVVLSSEWGLAIYLTVPARQVRCDARTLWLLLSDLDATWWMLGDTNLTVVSLIHAPVGSQLLADDGSAAKITEGVWTNPRFAGEIRNQAEDVVLARRPRVSLTVLRAERDSAIERRKAVRSTGPFALAWDFDIFPPTYPFKIFEWYESGDK